MDAKKWAVLTAAGNGSRLPSDRPKQFLEIGGKPVLMHSIEAFHRYSPAIEIMVVLPQYQISFWERLCAKHQFLITHQMVAGGSTRSESVRQALAAITSTEGLVAIHDGVRPLVSQALIEKSFRLAEDKGVAIPTVPLKDSIRLLKGESNEKVCREDYRLVQTPQTFRLPLIREAYSRQAEAASDDASVAEQAGYAIYLFDGEDRNIKITTRVDLHLAEALLKEG